jgi:hypothetical protein
VRCVVGVNATIPAGDVLLAVGPGLVAEGLRMTAGETGALMGRAYCGRLIRRWQSGTK